MLGYKTFLDDPLDSSYGCSDEPHDISVPSGTELGLSISISSIEEVSPTHQARAKTSHIRRY